MDAPRVRRSLPRTAKAPTVARRAANRAGKGEAARLAAALAALDRRGPAPLPAPARPWVGPRVIAAFASALALGCVAAPRARSVEAEAYVALRAAYLAHPTREALVGVPRTGGPATVLALGDGDGVEFAIEPGEWAAVGHAHPRQAGRVHLGCSVTDTDMGKLLRSYGVDGLYLLEGGTRLTKC